MNGSGIFRIPRPPKRKVGSSVLGWHAPRTMRSCLTPRLPRHRGACFTDRGDSRLDGSSGNRLVSGRLPRGSRRAMVRFWGECAAGEGGTARPAEKKVAAVLIPVIQDFRWLFVARRSPVTAEEWKHRESARVAPLIRVTFDWQKTLGLDVETARGCRQAIVEDESVTC